MGIESVDLDDFHLVGPAEVRIGIGTVRQAYAQLGDRCRYRGGPNQMRNFDL
jgi:hypothetical protein